MPSPPAAPIERARPLLGTLVAIRITGLKDAAAHRAIDTGFGEIARIHGLMSFHEPASDLSRLNRDAATKALRVDPDTFAVMRRALELAEASNGAFDPTVAARLVAWGYLPRPDSGRAPDRRATWRDIELIAPDKIRFHRPLWVDFGGIAKGYAVDRAFDRMALGARIRGCVNAGGDLRVVGPGAERVLLRVPQSNGMVPVVEIENGSIASSSGREHRKRRGSETLGPHVDTARGRAMGTRSFVSVTAPQCLDADALTKVVLALGARSSALLSECGATAHLYNARDGWRTYGAGT